MCEINLEVNRDVFAKGGYTCLQVCDILIICNIFKYRYFIDIYYIFIYNIYIYLIYYAYIIDIFKIDWEIFNLTIIYINISILIYIYTKKHKFL